ncbi:MAG: extracellular solute-binding protein [Ancrocorticia sp.]|jgi:lactose/L-arabinose transport system substrate-binding protein|nr:extracellular solute-binding protein [Ancrocorticia sp.]MCI2178399.1 extracellular solute-binding protein [Ancrocorticia sp.]MCI2193206.1 extracellular solute-binding protein [Ancrocorticia sp.]MCI2199539.1 extracellular solute-binding protein [Ancrocorticia sp.]
MKRTRKLGTLAAAVMLPLSLALAACGGSGSTSEASASAGGSGSSDSLTVWAWDPNFNIAAMKEAEKIYQEDHPDFSLNIVETPWDDLQTKLTTLAQSQQTSELPDIFLIQNNACQKNVINYPELFSDYSDSSVDFSEFPDSVKAYCTVDGKQYGVPFDQGTAITALRTDVLEQAGLTVDDFTDITWDKFLELGKQVKEKTGMPLLSGQAGSSDTIMMMLQSAGASLFDDDGNPTIVDNTALEASINMYKELVDAGVFLEVNSWDEYVNTLVNSQVAGTINGAWIIASIQTADDQSGKWNITNLPKLDGVDGATNYSANGGSSWAISSNANYDLASDFLAKTFAGSTELYDTILPTTGAIANWTPAGQSDVYSEPSEFFGGQKIFQMIVEYGSKVPSNNTGAYYYEARDAVSSAIQEIIAGSDMDDSLKQAQENVEFAMQ